MDGSNCTVLRDVQVKLYSARVKKRGFARGADDDVEQLRPALQPALLHVFLKHVLHACV